MTTLVKTIEMMILTVMLKKREGAKNKVRKGSQTADDGNFWVHGSNKHEIIIFEGYDARASRYQCELMETEVIEQRTKKTSQLQNENKLTNSE